MILTKLSDKQELTKYTITLSCDESLNSVSNITLSLRDILSNDVTEFSNQDLLDASDDSLIPKGIYYSQGNSEITLSFLTRAYPKDINSSLPTIGFNPSQAILELDDYVYTFYVPLLPYIERKNEDTYVYNKYNLPDPVLPALPEHNDRPDYDFSDYRKGFIETNLTYSNGKDWMYVNTAGDPTVKQDFSSTDSDMVPLYCSDVYCYYANRDTHRNINSKTLEEQGVEIKQPTSYLFDENSNQVKTIYYDFAPGCAADSFGHAYHTKQVDINDDYMTELYYVGYTQYIYWNKKTFSQNSLRIKFNTDNLPISYEEKIVVPTDPEEEDPDYVQDYLLCCREQNKSFVIDGQNVSFSCQCYVTSKSSSSLKPETNNPHILQIYAAEEQQKYNQYGTSEFKFLDLNMYYRKTTDTIKINVYVDDEVAFTITCKGDNTYTIDDSKNTTGMIIDTVNVDWITTTQYATISWTIKNIDLTEVKQYTIYCTAQVTPAEKSEQEDQETKQYAECSPDTWSRNNNKAVIDQWEVYTGYVLFANAHLNLDGAYIGVNAIYAPSVELSNAYVDCTIYIAGGDSYASTGYALQSKAGLNTRSFTDKLKVYHPSDAISSGTVYTGDSLYSGEGITINPNGHAEFYINEGLKIHTENPTYVKAITRSNSSIGPVPTYNYHHDSELFSDDKYKVEVNNGEEHIFDSNGKIADYGNLNVGNNCKLTFKSGGEYHFNTITIGTNLTLTIEDISETTTPYVRICCDGFNCSNMMNIVNKNTELTSFILYARKTDPDNGNEVGTGNISFAATSDESQNYGILVAPEGKVVFGNTIIWTGAVWATELTMQNGCEFHSK